jgi:stage II sporulation protein AA (anti-sigma F factor antagonist)
MIQYKKPNKERKIFNMCAARDRKPGFDSEFTGTILKIKLRGEIDHHSAVAVRSAIDDMIRSRRPCELVIDMSAVDFMDSSGLGLIMGRYNTMKEIGGGVTVADPNPTTEKIMNLAGLERIIKITRSQARAQARGGSGVARATVMSVGQAGRPSTHREGGRKALKKENEEMKNEKSKI